MLKSSARSAIRLRGVRHNNLKNFDLDLPLNQLIVITGLSGSGKSSLAFDTLFAEGQRRYIETFSPYARQFFDRMDKPQVDSIEGIPPAIAIEQRNAVRTTRSTVGTMTEICDYMKMLWPHLAQLHCRQCGQPVRKDSPQAIWNQLSQSLESPFTDPSGLAPKGGVPGGRSQIAESPLTEFLITFDLPLTEKLSLAESLALVAKQGYQRLLLDDEIVRLDEAQSRITNHKSCSLTVIQDRLRLTPPNRARFIEACEQAYHFGKGKLAIRPAQPAGRNLPQGGTDIRPAATARQRGENKPKSDCRTEHGIRNTEHPPSLKLPPSPGLRRTGRRAGALPAFALRAAARQVTHPSRRSQTKADHSSPAFAEATAGRRITYRFSNRLHCAECDLEYRDPSPALFSFNHPLGACPACRGFGRTISIDYNLAMPERLKTLAQGVVKPWQTGQSAECQTDLLRACHHFEIPTDIPFEKLPKKWQDFVIDGEPDYGKDEEHEWPRAWYGVKGYFRWLESKAYKMHVRVLLSRYRAYTPCPVCHGQRFQPDALLYRVHRPPLVGTSRRVGTASPTPSPYLSAVGTRSTASPASSPCLPAAGTSRRVGTASPTSPPSNSLTLADFYQLPIRHALKFIETLSGQPSLRPGGPLGLVLQEVRSRLGYLEQVGLGYLTLDRPTRSLSGGETERVNLTTCLGTRLVNTLFVLDEPSVGLHPRDTERLVRILEQLRDAGNTVVVVEHEASVMRAANQIVDLGPGHGATGGQVIFQGPYPSILKSKHSLTGQYLSGQEQIQIPRRRPTRVGQASCLSSPLGKARCPSLFYGNASPTSDALALNDANTGPPPLPATKERGEGWGEGQRKNAPPLPFHEPLEGASLLPRPVRDERGEGRGEGTTKKRSSSPQLSPEQGPDASGFRTEQRESREHLSTSCPTLTLTHASVHNLKDLTVEIPLARFVCVTGVSGSGKTTLVREVLLPALTAHFKSAKLEVKASDRLAAADIGADSDDGSALSAAHPPLLLGAEHLGQVVLVDQSILAKTPRSNPAVYIGAFDDLREFFAQSEPARRRGLNASAFSFNSAQGQCERCRGAGFEKIEMQFLSDVFIRCPDCNGHRYRPHILEVKIAPEEAGVGGRVSRAGDAAASRTATLPARVRRSPAVHDEPPSFAKASPFAEATEDGTEGRRITEYGTRITPYASRITNHASLSIADLLDSTVEEALDFLAAFPDSRPAQRAHESLKLLAEVGLGYLKLGQPINTLSGGESQRLKLVRHLAEVIAGNEGFPTHPPTHSTTHSPPPPPTLFLFDEPTTGLHFDDVRVLLAVFQRLVDAGHSVLVIEHNLDVIKSADWIIDLGPEAGDQGGQIVAQGTPEAIAARPQSHTGQALREVLGCDVSSLDS